MITAENWLEQQIVQADSDRTRWQLTCIKQWAERGYRGTIEAATGTGKSRIGLYAIAMLQRNDSSRKAIVVVPTRPLKSQWEKKLKKWKLRAEVWVVNSYIKGFHTCSLLVIDEAHRMAATTFSQVFNVTQYSFILGLTATMKRTDGKHYIVAQYAPVFHKLPLALARAKGWVANYQEYWLGLELSEKDRAYYDQLIGKFEKMFSYFSMDFESMKIAAGNIRYCTTLASRTGHPATALQHYAMNGMKYLRKIRKWLIEHPAKITAAEQIISALNRKTITFGESIAVAEDLADRLGDKAMAYHSEMEAIELDTYKDKVYKTEQGARRAAERLGGIYKFKHGKHVCQLRVTKKLAGKKLQDYVLHKIINTKQLMTICTAKSLSEGFDFPGAELGITLSRSSSEIRYVQETGRIVRLSEGKTPIMIHIYLTNTKDEQWLRKAGAQSIGRRIVYSVEELLEFINKYEQLQHN